MKAYLMDFKFTLKVVEFAHVNGESLRASEIRKNFLI